GTERRRSKVCPGSYGSHKKISVRSCCEAASCRSSAVAVPSVLEKPIARGSNSDKICSLSGGGIYSGNACHQVQKFSGGRLTKNSSKHLVSLRSLQANE